MDTLRCQGGNPFNLSISILEHFMEGLGQHHLVTWIPGFDTWIPAFPTGGSSFKSPLFCRRCLVANFFWGENLSK